MSRGSGGVEGGGREGSRRSGGEEGSGLRSDHMSINTEPFVTADFTIMFASMAQTLMLLFFLIQCSALSSSSSPPTPAPWPEQFHSILFMNYSGALSLIDLWYDWPNGRNFNIMQDQLGRPPLYDLEWNNGTSFLYRLPDSSSPSCRSVQLPVGILRPNWLDGATYLGRSTVDGFLCDGWEKADFIRYYEDVATRRPVNWVFYTGREAHVMTFEVGAALDDSKWQAPAYCFEEKGSVETSLDDFMPLRAF